MQEPAWKKLIRDLNDSGRQSVYLDRLRDRLHVSQSQDELKKEILQEIASALGRAEDKVILALLRLELLGEEVRELEEREERGEAPAGELDARIDAYNAQRRTALRCLWELTTHREALGFRRNEVLREFYPVPPPKARVTR